MKIFVIKIYHKYLTLIVIINNWEWNINRLNIDIINNILRLKSKYLSDKRKEVEVFGTEHDEEVCCVEIEEEDRCEYHNSHYYLLHYTYKLFF